MPKIKWIGLIKEEKMKDYQVGELSKNAKKMNMPTTSKEMMIKALPFIIPALVILFLSVYFKSGEFFLLRLYIIIGVLLGCLYWDSETNYICSISFISNKKKKIYSYVSVTLHFRNNTIDFILDNAYNRYENT